MIEDKAHTHASKNDEVGIVGETRIWDGPLDQAGRLHGKGSSNGSRGMKLKLAAVPMEACCQPITQVAKG
jgi:hypothetical protein